MVRLGVVTPLPPLTVSLTVKYPGFFLRLPLGGCFALRLAVFS